MARGLTTAPVRHGQVGTFVRFVLVNLANTGLYWALYLGLLLVSPYFVANALALLVAVLLAYVANARYAFRVATSRGSLVKYLVANGTTVLLRMAVVWVLVAALSLPEQLAPPAGVAITTPIAYLLTRWAMATRRGVGAASRVTVTGADCAVVPSGPAL